MSTLNNNIGLYIAGTQKRQGGFNALVIIHPFPWTEGYDKEMDRAPIVNEKPAYSVKHREDGIVIYNLLDSYVKPCDASTMGRLTISLSIPKGMRIAGGKSPYNLLKEIYEVFRSKYMKYVPTANYDTFIDFDSASVEKDLFTSIIAKYDLEPRNSEYITMNPQGRKGVLNMPLEKIERFFSDTMYDEFEEFSEIEIGSDAKTKSSYELENIEVPRRQKYTVYVNGKPSGRKLGISEDEFDTELVMKGTENIKYNNFRFTLGELKGSPEGRLRRKDGSVELDEAAHEIRCTVKVKTYEMTISYDGPAAKSFESKIKNREVVLYVMGDEKVEINQGFNKIPSNSIEIPVNKGEKALFSIDAKSIDTFKNNVKCKYTPKSAGDAFDVKINTIPDVNNYKVDVIIIVNKASKKADNKPITPGTGTGTNNNWNSQNTTDKSKGKLYAIIGAVVAVLVIIGVVFFVTSSDDDSYEDAQLAEEVTVSDENSEEKDLNAEADEFSAESEDSLGTEKVEEITEETVEEPKAEPEKPKAPTREDYRKQILDLANSGNIVKIRTMSKYLKGDELSAFEAVLGDLKVNFPNASAAGRMKMKKEIEKSKPFYSIEDVVALRTKLLGMQN